MTGRHAKLRVPAGHARAVRPLSAPPPATPLREALAVLFICAASLLTLALASYSPGDISLNSRGGPGAHNWAGPVGALCADALLQACGVGAGALAVALALAGARAFVGQRLWPGLRELFGLVLWVAALATLAQLAAPHDPLAFAPGGVVGTVLAAVLRRYFALPGALVLATGGAALALALTAQGALRGLGVRGRDAVRAGGRLAWRSAHRLGHAARPLGSWLRRAAAAAARTRPWDPGHRHVRAVAARAGKAGAPRAGKAASPGAVEAVVPGDVAAVVPGDVAAVVPGDVAAVVPGDVAAVVPGDVAAVVPGDVAAGVPPAATCEPQIVDVRPDRPGAAMGSGRHAGSGIVAVADPGGADAGGADALPLRPAARAATMGARPFVLPPVDLLDDVVAVRAPLEPQRLRERALRLTATLQEYGIEGHVREIRPGPVVTMYEYVPGPGVKLSKIAALADDLAMSMEALQVRIVAPIPGKGAVGIEIPNEARETVYLRELIAHDSFQHGRSALALALGKDIEGAATIADLTRMPHLLVAGATGAGKSVSINAMIMSVLFRATPAQVRMIMVDPKMLELSIYEGIPHLLLPVVTDPKKAALALRWAVEEMERRYALLSAAGVRSIDGYNARLAAATARGEALPGTDPEAPPLPLLLVIVDELADLMMVASREVESSIMRLAQMARAAGIHLILATQRPSVDVLTGVIKANFPTRIAFQVASRHDSRTIIDGNGAEHLLGRGDMLYLSPGVGGISRLHGAYVSDEEIKRAVAHVRAQARPQYDESILQPRGDDGEEQGPEEAADAMYDQAVAVVAEARQASVSMIQRRLRIGYNRAARMVERMEREGVVGPADGIKPREVLVASL